MYRQYETERLILRTLDVDDAHKSLEYYKKNKDFLKPYEPTRLPVFYTLDHHKHSILAEQEAMNQLKNLRLWLFKKSDLSFSQPIGTVSFSNIIRGCFSSCFLGYTMDKDHLRKGYMTEALETSIRVIFCEYQLHRIEANIMPRNHASLGLVTRLGFRNEGLAKSYLMVNGQWEDHIHMVLLNDTL